MVSSLFLIVVFVLAFRLFAPLPALTTAAAIPCVILAGLFAMTFFEPAGQLATISTGPMALLRPEADFVCFMLLFAGALAIQLKLLTLFPAVPKLPQAMELRATVTLTCIASYLVMAITLTACDTSPRFQRGLGLSPDRAALLGFIAPDTQWLFLVGLISDGSLSRPRPTVPESTPGDATTSSPGDAPTSPVFTVDHPRTLRRRFVEHPESTEVQPAADQLSN